MSLLSRHLSFLEALRGAGLSVSLAEGLDAVDGLGRIGWGDRELVREVYAATMVKRQPQRPTFDLLFDLFYPPLVGEGRAEGAPGEVRDNPEALADLVERLGEALATGDRELTARLATEAVGRLGGLPGRGQSPSGWSAYHALRRVDPGQLVAQIVAALRADGLGVEEAERLAGRRIGEFTGLVEADARRRVAEVKGPEHLARVAVRPAIDRVDFTAAKRADLDQMRREIYPLARRLATRLTQEHHARRRGPLDVRRTVRASISSGGVPLETHHRPKRPHRSDLVVLCDVSGSVASFARFTLLLVFALREQFGKVRAFTFVDRVHEVSDCFRPGADPGDVLAELSARTVHAAQWGRTNYGRAFGLFEAEHVDAIGPRSALLVLGDARSNYADLNLPALTAMAGRARHSWWLNPEHPRHWDSGDSAASRYGEIVPMVECRNLQQLGRFVHDLV